ncbi:hypothetical protein EYF80_053828 [Liparis tanakae]|uniref:Uncharacterized protein n=1 Tax=Liparis tanakae TaxID=230148 RepID=A0A4Z2F575_9TELE|nr:hypothetical protein EYF80_053828 [Liparis tanakae]
MARADAGHLASLCGRTPPPAYGRPEIERLTYGPLDCLNEGICLLDFCHAARRPFDAAAPDAPIVFHRPDRVVYLHAKRRFPRA